MESRKFQDRRRALGLTQQRAADEIGVSKRAVAAWETGETPISRMAELAAWAVNARHDLNTRLTMLRSGKMTTGEKRIVDGQIVDCDTTAESIERIEMQLAEIDAVEKEAKQYHRSRAFDIGEVMMSLQGYCVQVRNRHRGPIATIEFPTREAAEAATACLNQGIAGANAITDTRGTTWTDDAAPD